MAVGNPSFDTYDAATGSLETGSVDIFKYRAKTDEHELVGTLHKRLLDTVLLATDPYTGDLLSTEPSGSSLGTKNKNLAIDENEYVNTYDDLYGVSVDLNKNHLIVGCPYYSYTSVSGSDTVGISGSVVELYDMLYYEVDPYVTRAPVTMSYTSFWISGSTISQSYYNPGVNWNIYAFSVTASVPPNWDFVQFKSSDDLINYYVIDEIPVNRAGGTYSRYYVVYPTGNSQYLFAVAGTRTDPYDTTITNPDLDVTASFGRCVSINDRWLAVGSPYVSGSRGMVYIYENTGDTYADWTLTQKLDCPVDSAYLFGSDLELDKSSYFSGSLIVGGGNPANQTAYLYYYTGSSWQRAFTFTENFDKKYPLTFIPNGMVYPAYETNISTSFGNAVSKYGTHVVIGAPTDRKFYEFSGSSLYQQGAAYFFEECGLGYTNYSLLKKVYGNERTMKNHNLGYSVDVFDEKATIGIPRINVDTVNTCYFEGSLTQQLYCGADLENTINGQWMYLSYNTSSGDWETINVYQKKKNFLEPFRTFGFDVGIADKSIVVGAPILFTDSNREINIGFTSSAGAELADLSGKAYIYNIDNFRPEIYVGNVFYRNGKMVIMTSGSYFDGLFFNAVNPYEYEYNVSLKGKHTIYEKNVICRVEPGEFNVSTNPTAVVYETASFDLNKNGRFDFQDADVLLRYMRRKNTEMLEDTASTDWSSSVLLAEDELNFYNYHSQSWIGTDTLYSSSYTRFETIDTEFKTILDFNQDDRIDLNDMNILWKYFSNRLTQTNYTKYITPTSQRREYSDIYDFIDGYTKKSNPLLINPYFLDYNSNIGADPTGSYLTPMVTTIGLYHQGDLVATAKLANPVKIIPDLPINFVVRMDF